MHRTELAFDCRTLTSYIRSDLLCVCVFDEIIKQYIHFLVFIFLRTTHAHMPLEITNIISSNFDIQTSAHKNR